MSVSGSEQGDDAGIIGVEAAAGEFWNALDSDSIDIRRLSEEVVAPALGARFATAFSGRGEDDADAAIIEAKRELVKVLNAELSSYRVREFVAILSEVDGLELSEEEIRALSAAYGSASLRWSVAEDGALNLGMRFSVSSEDGSLFASEDEMKVRRISAAVVNHILASVLTDLNLSVSAVSIVQREARRSYRGRDFNINFDVQISLLAAAYELEKWRAAEIGAQRIHWEQRQQEKNSALALQEVIWDSELGFGVTGSNSRIKSIQEVDFRSGSVGEDDDDEGFDDSGVVIEFDGERVNVSELVLVLKVIGINAVQGTVGTSFDRKTALFVPLTDLPASWKVLDCDKEGQSEAIAATVARLKADLRGARAVIRLQRMQNELLKVDAEVRGAQQVMRAIFEHMLEGTLVEPEVEEISSSRFISVEQVLAERERLYGETQKLQRAISRDERLLADPGEETEQMLLTEAEREAITEEERAAQDAELQERIAKNRDEIRDLREQIASLVERLIASLEARLQSGALTCAASLRGEEFTGFDAGLPPVIDLQERLAGDTVAWQEMQELAVSTVAAQVCSLLQAEKLGLDRLSRELGVKLRVVVNFLADPRIVMLLEKDEEFFAADRQEDLSARIRANLAGYMLAKLRGAEESLTRNRDTYLAACEEYRLYRFAQVLAQHLGLEVDALADWLRGLQAKVAGRERVDLPLVDIEKSRAIRERLQSGVEAEQHRRAEAAEAAEAAALRIQRVWRGLVGRRVAQKRREKAALTFLRGSGLLEACRRRLRQELTRSVAGSVARFDEHMQSSAPGEVVEVVEGVANPSSTLGSGRRRADSLGQSHLTAEQLAAMHARIKTGARDDLRREPAGSGQQQQRGGEPVVLRREGEDRPSSCQPQ